jgi:hypothetical protein
MIMSPSSPATVRDLFDGLNSQSSRVETADEESVSRAMKDAAGAIQWTATASTLVPKIAELLDVALPSILVEFWQKADEVATALRESRESPDETIEVSLYDCSTEATLEPYIEVRLTGKGPGKKIPFTISLPMTFKAVELKIQNGSIVDATAGICEIEGTLSLEKVQLAKLKKPVRIQLGEGLLSGVSHDALSARRE